LIVAALAIAYIGINTVMANTESFNFLGMKFDVSNESGKMKGFLYIGLAVVLFGVACIRSIKPIISRLFFETVNVGFQCFEFLT
jgi:hypothetical protein